MADFDLIGELAEWMRGREAIWDLMECWPPNAAVRAREGYRLMVPAPGVVGHIGSYFENGNVRVTTPLARTVTSPITGITMPKGEMIGGELDPAGIELVEYGDVTPEMVREARARLESDA